MFDTVWIGRRVHLKGFGLYGEVVDVRDGGTTLVIQWDSGERSGISTALVEVVDA